MLSQHSHACVHTGIEVHVPFVTGQVVQAVRDQFALPCTGEIMIEVDLFSLQFVQLLVAGFQIHSKLSFPL